VRTPLHAVIGVSLVATAALDAPAAPLADGSRIMTTTDDEPLLHEAFLKMVRTMVNARTDELGTLLDGGFTLVHMTGRAHTKREWLSAIDSGQMRYHAAQERSVTVTVTGDTAVLVARSLVTATIYSARGTWNLQLTTDYTRRNGNWIAMRTVATTF
jgi:hypothetical protein